MRHPGEKGAIVRIFPALKNRINNLQHFLDESLSIVVRTCVSSNNMADPVEVEQMSETKPRKMALPTSLDKDAIREAYEEVRSNLSDHEWAVFKFDGLKIVCSAKGQGFEEFCGEFHDDERAFGYIRIQMGDEMSKRSKFLFLTWIGPEVGVMQRAKMSTDKSIIKDVINNFAVELQVETSVDLDLEMFKAHLNKAGGANYGTGVREL